MARTNDVWETGVGGTYIQTIGPSGYDLLINGTNHYLNFNTTVGSSGYGLRDNAGTMEFKNSGGSWAAIGSGAPIGGSVSGGTDGSVLFVHPSGTLAQDNSNFFWDATNQRLGLKTVSPNTTLTLLAESASKVGVSIQEDTGSANAFEIGYFTVGGGGFLQAFNRTTNHFLPYYMAGLTFQLYTGDFGSNTVKLAVNAAGNVLINGFSSSTIGQIIKGAASQSADLQEWQNSSGTALSLVTAAGWHQQTQGRARNTADVTNATATFANLSDLTLTLVAGRKYTGRMVFKGANSTATEGLQFDFNGGTATMTSFFAGAGILASGGTDVIGANISTSLAGVINFTTFTGESVIIFEISLVCNAGGTFIPRFAENTSAIGTATARLGSFLWLEDSPN